MDTLKPRIDHRRKLFRNMKSNVAALFFTLLLAVATPSHGETSDLADERVVPAFAESLKMLQREPPSAPSKTRATIEVGWIEQKLDHFDEAEERVWQMRYFGNDEHFVEGGPMFIYLGGEWAITPGRISGGHWYDLAKENQGMLYYTEHRYYGESMPTSDLTLESLQYLHVKQALADLAHFIQHQRATVPGLANSKVIIAGGSYSATMVVWFKRLYPDLVAGGWASSAPILAKVDFREYKEVVGRAMQELGSQQCYNRIQRGFAELEAMFANNRGAEVKAMIKICDNFDENNDLDLWTLFGTMSNIFSSVVQYQSGSDVQDVCEYLMEQEDDVSAIANMAVTAFGRYRCLDMTYQDTLTYYLDTSYKYGASRPWYYQTCNEYGWYQTSGSRQQPFGTKFPSTLHTTLCADVFGEAEYTNENIHRHAEQTNVDFGGLIPDVKNVYMTHGGFDPWNAIGLNEAEGATVITNASHCADFASISDKDSEEMRASKERLAALVFLWLTDIDDSPVADKARKFMKQILH